jgi:hypothetical protein
MSRFHVDAPLRIARERERPLFRYLAMDRTAILERLDEAERFVADSECQIARQKAIISRLVMDNLDAEPARVLLFQFEEMHSLHIAERDRLRAVLAATG